MRLTAGWEVSWTVGSAGDFHALTPNDEATPQVWVHVPPTPALVLGSTQPDQLVDHRAAAVEGVEVCRRRSGGGLVWIDPGTDCWIDVIVPCTSRHWDDDVGRAFHWLGSHWADVLAAEGFQPTLQLSSAGGTDPAGRIWCFAGTGHGELTLDGHKIMGLSQRRTKKWIRLQSLLLGVWPGAELDNLVDLAAGAALTRNLDGNNTAALAPELVKAGFPPGSTPPDPTAVAERFVELLPQA